MNEKSRVVTVTLVGAVVGGLAGYVFFTERGRWLRRRLEPVLDDLARELDGAGGTVARAAVVAGEGWRLLSDALGGVAREDARALRTRPARLVQPHVRSREG